jgi:hypothetical protein
MLVHNSSYTFSKNQQLSRWQGAYLLVLTEIISSTLKMEAIFSSETSVATEQITRRQIPEDDTLHNHRCESLKSYVEVYFVTMHEKTWSELNGAVAGYFKDITYRFHNSRGFLDQLYG